MTIWRVLLAIIFPPFAVVDRGCGSFCIVLLLTLGLDSGSDSCIDNTEQMKQQYSIFMLCACPSPKGGGTDMTNKLNEHMCSLKKRKVKICSIVLN